METYYYGHDYEDQTINKRLSKIEKTIYRYKRLNTPINIRFKDAYNQFKNKKSPFYNGKNTDPPLSHSQMELLLLMERRLLGSEKKELPLDERLKTLEIYTFGKGIDGNVQKRFDHLSRNTPLRIKGVRVSQNGKTIASFKPDYKKVPLPNSPHINNFTPLDITYDNRAGDYYNEIAKNSYGEILRWNDFPVYVYIHSKNEEEKKISQLAIEHWQNKVPIQITNDYTLANILIDWASKGRFVTVPIATKINNKRRIKILINLGGIQNTERQDTLPIFIMHQLGHALGIWGHSDDINDLMYPIGRMGLNDINIKKENITIYQPIMLQTKRSNITTRDLNTLLRIYQTSTSISRLSN